MKRSLVVFLLTAAVGEEKAGGKGRQTLVAFMQLYFFCQIDGSRVLYTIEQPHRVMGMKEE